MPTQLPKIFIAESSGFSADATRLLREHALVELADLNRSELISKVGEADVLWIRLRYHIDAEILDAAPRLQAIASPTTGLNHIDLAAAQSRGIQIISLRGESDFLKNVYATAEHTMGLIFGLIRHVPAAFQNVTSGGWDRDLFMGRELHGKAAGIVGYGRVGRMVAGFLRVFGMRVYATDPTVPQGYSEEGITFVPLEALLERSDLVSVHVSLTDKTHSFLGRREFALMKEGAWFINTARGEVIDEEALLHVLQSGHLAGAALDVLSHEESSGMGPHALVKYAQQHQNLIITPHIGGCTTESREKTENFLAERVVEFLRNRQRNGSLAYSKTEVIAGPATS
jgi:D-3-phosphoglycerate dehydrogenase / 2-oxoglutarate reductase